MIKPASRCVCLGLMAAIAAILMPGLSLSVASAESVTIPGYNPQIGVEHVYRSRKSTVTDMSMWFDNPAATAQTMRGDFRQRMTVSAKTTGGYIVGWKLGADVPPGGTGTFEMNNMFRNTLAAYGVDQLDIETDLGGNSISLPGLARIMENVNKAVAAGGPASPESSLPAIMDMLENNPLAVVEALVPEATILAALQSSESATYEIGQNWEVAQEEDIKGVTVPVKSTWKVESTDPEKQTVTMSWTEVSDPEAITKTQQVAIERLMLSFDEKVKKLSSDQLAYVRSASKKREGRAVISLRDGSSMEVTEVVTMNSGGMKFITTINVVRED